MASDFIVDVSEADFEYQVLTFSQQIPVVVDFWAVWCAPCRVLGPVLEKLANEAQGAFRLAKVNVDENSNLANQYNVRSIPAVKAIRNGKVIAEFLGAQPEPEVRAFIRRISPDPNDLMIEKGNGLLEMNQAIAAENTFRKVLESTPESAPARLGLVKSLLLQGDGDESMTWLTDFPISREYNSAEILRPVAEALANYDASILSADDSLEAAYLSALRLVKRGNLEAALDGLLDILRQDKRFRKGQVHRLVLGILELMGDNQPDTREYRNELASILF